MPLKKRIKATFDIIQKAEGIYIGDIEKIEAAVFVMADKFLGQMEMEKIKEEVRMMKLG